MIKFEIEKNVPVSPIRCNLPHSGLSGRFSVLPFTTMAIGDSIFINNNEETLKALNCISAKKLHNALSTHVYKESKTADYKFIIRTSKTDARVILGWRIWKVAANEPRVNLRKPS